MRQSILKSCVSLAVLSIAGVSTAAFAQAAPAAQADAAKPADTLGEIVVTASSGNRSKLDSSVSISSVSASVIADFHPMSEGDMLRLLPGLQPNVSGPGGNGNFAVRGLPVATGGATFVQLQEDGLPMTLYGDIQFGNNDYWTKSGPTDERVEAIRGGTTATLASQAPGAVVNYISYTGRGDGGYVQAEKGVNYDFTKISFLDRGSISDSMYYNIGGFYDVGHGPRHASYNVSNSYQIKGNITKEIDGNKGYFRLLFKVADTNEPNDAGGLVCGTISGNVASNLSTCGGFDIKKRSMYSLYNTDVSYVTGNGNLVSNPLRGISTREKALQAQLHYKFDNGITLDDNGRYASMSGGFNSNFLSINPIQNTVAGVTCAANSPAANGLIGSCVNGAIVKQAVYSAGPNAGHNVTEGYYNNNTNVATNISDEGSFVNDMKLSWKGDLGDGAKANLTAGWFYMSQRVAMDWHPNQFNMQVTGSNPSPIDLISSTGALLSAHGYTGYNNNWGSCCERNYNYTFTDNAPYADLIVDYNKFGLDVSLRDDINHGSGSGVASSGVVHTLPQTTVNPVTGATTTVNIPYFLADGTPEVMNYSKSLLSWSAGVNYKAAENLNLFIRASKGNRFNADRLSFGGNFNADGTLNTAGQTAVSDQVYQYEIGLKNRGTIGEVRYTTEFTVYTSHFNISTYELNPNVCIPLGFAGGTCPIFDKYKTTGAEFYSTLRYGGLNLIANMTYNKAKKQPGGVGSFTRSNGIPDLSYSLAANYDVSKIASVGLDVAGVTSELNSNGVQFPGSRVVSANFKLKPVQNLQFGLNVYNLFNSLALMGPDNANEITTGNTFIGTASSAVGRTITADVKFSF